MVFTLSVFAVHIRHINARHGSDAFWRMNAVWQAHGAMATGKFNPSTGKLENTISPWEAISPVLPKHPDLCACEGDAATCAIVEKVIIDKGGLEAPGLVASGRFASKNGAGCGLDALVDDAPAQSLYERVVLNWSSA